MVTYRKGRLLPQTLICNSTILVVFSKFNVENINSILVRIIEVIEEERITDFERNIFINKVDFRSEIYKMQIYFLYLKSHTILL